jgi:hypothetical protein
MLAQKYCFSAIHAIYKVKTPTKQHIPSQYLTNINPFTPSKTILAALADRQQH